MEFYLHMPINLCLFGVQRDKFTFILVADGGDVMVIMIMMKAWLRQSPVWICGAQ